VWLFGPHPSATRLGSSAISFVPFVVPLGLSGLCGRPFGSARVPLDPIWDSCATLWGPSALLGGLSGVLLKPFWIRT
jgi:hypothetical protein